MLKIIKMDLYKMFKSKSFYILNLVLILLTLFFASIMAITLNREYEAAQESTITMTRDAKTLDGKDPTLTEEEYYALQEEFKEGMNVDEFITMIYSQQFLLVLLAIFIGLFICSEWDTGFIKNIIPIRNSRYSLIISKIIIVLLFILTQAVFAIIGSFIANYVISGDIKILNSNVLIKYIGVQTLLNMAFASLLVFISYLFRNKALSMSIGIMLAVNIHGIFLNLIDKVIDSASFSLSDYTIIGNILTTYDSSDYKRAVIVSIIYFLIYNILSIIRTKSVEVN